MQENNQKDTENKLNDLMQDGIAPTEVKQEPAIEPVAEDSGSITTDKSDAVQSEQSDTFSDEGSTMDTTPLSTSAGSSNNIVSFLKRYGLMAGVIVVMGLGLLFLLEKEGRVDVGLSSLFSSNQPAAIVNGSNISREDYDSSLNQLLQVAGGQGLDTTDPAVVEQYKSQAIDTLVNGELLKQAAKAEGIVVTSVDVEARLVQIAEGVGGDEALKAKMVEFGITEATLRRDIESEILIQGLFDVKMNVNDIEVAEAEITKLYTDLGGEGGGLPPLTEVREQITQQIKQNKQQELVTSYIEELRAKATIEILV